ncbi:MAG TPA: DUF1269 domain-containing protein [Candidatus Limnocylindrales bacterium]|nr:DUF1269 domain-containing protein [Candidatus Limnocylindrales bacterium]
MSQLLVITFGKRETAGQAAERLKDVQGAHGIDLSDVAVVEKDADGKVHVHHGLDKVTAGGAIAGGVLGLLLGLVFFPLAGLAIGAAFGGLIGRSLHQNVDSKLVEDVTADLTPDTSALFVIGSGNPAAVVGALEPFKGRVYQTTLDPETEAQIQAALDREA